MNFMLQGERSLSEQHRGEIGIVLLDGEALKVLILVSRQTTLSPACVSESAPEKG